MRRTIVLIVAITVALFFPQVVWAQTEPITIKSNAMLTVPRSVRGLAMGAAGAADDWTPDNAFFNPANLQSLTYYYASTSYNEWADGVDFFDVGVGGGESVPLENNRELRLSFMTKFAQFTIAPDADNNVGLPNQTETFRDWYMLMTGALGLTFGRTEFGGGISFKPFSMNTESRDDPTNGWAFDLGGTAKTTFFQGGPVRVIPSLGIAVLNLGKSVEIAPNVTRTLPEQTRLGASLRLESDVIEGLPRFFSRGPAFTLAANFDWAIAHNSLNDDVIGVGAEAGALDIIYIRLGAFGKQDSVDNMTLGAGLQLKPGTVAIRLDYARFEAPVTGDADAVAFAISYGF